MRKRFVIPVVLAALPVAAGAQNDRVDERWTDDAPAVRLYFENSRSLVFGQTARVRFRVDKDAYVMVGRIDSDGRMTILFPYSRFTRAYVKGGEETFVRSRRGGTGYSFAAYEPWGIGFVFAIASYEPMDFSRFKTGDFASAEGTMTQLARRYHGNPQRIIERLAPWVLFDPGTPYDYDFVNYSVEAPLYANASSYCGLGYGAYGDAYYERSGCSGQTSLMYAMLCSGFYGLSYFCYDPIWWRFGRRTYITVNNGGQLPPPLPTTPTGGPNTKLIDQIGAPSEPGNTAGGLQKAQELNTRPSAKGATDDDDLGRIYTIPRRAIDDLRRQERIERRPVNEVAGGPADIYNRPTPRDPGSAPAGPSRPAGTGDQAGAGSPSRRDWNRTSDNPTTRGDTRPSADTGPRSYAPPPPREPPRRVDTPPSRSGNDRPEGRFDRPQRSFDPPPRSEPRATRGGNDGGGRAASPPPQHAAPPPRASSPPPRPSTTGEKKPTESGTKKPVNN